MDSVFYALVLFWPVLLTLSALTSHEKVLYGKPNAFKPFHNSFGLSMDSEYTFFLRYKAAFNF